MMEAARTPTPFSIRLPEELDDLISAEARRTGRSRGAVVRALTDEALRTRMFPGIAFAGPEHARRATLIGSGWDVWQVIAALEDLGSEEALLDAYELTARQVRAAIMYRDRYPDEIEQQIAENVRPVEELRRDFPFAELRGTG